MWTLQCDVELKRMSIRNSNDWEILNRNHETAEIRQINIQDSHIRVWRNDWTLSWMYQRTCRRKTSDWISAKIYQEIFEFVVCLDSWMNQHKPQAWCKWKHSTSDVLEIKKPNKVASEKTFVRTAWICRSRQFTPPIEIYFIKIFKWKYKRLRLRSWFHTSSTTRFTMKRKWTELRTVSKNSDSKTQFWLTRTTSSLLDIEDLNEPRSYDWKKFLALLQMIWVKNKWENSEFLTIDWMNQSEMLRTCRLNFQHCQTWIFETLKSILMMSSVICLQKKNQKKKRLKNMKRKNPVKKPKS